METYCFSNERLLGDLSNIAIRNKQQIIKIWLDLMITMIYYGDRDCSNSEIIVIKGDNIKRAFFLRESQIFSLHLPFDNFYKNSSGNDDKRFIIEISNIVIEGVHLKELKKLAKKISDEYLLNKIHEDIEDIGIKEDIYIILKTLMLAEDGYLRYDIDFKNHPNIPHHLDIFYSNTSTFKLGIDENTNTDGILPSDKHSDMIKILLDILNEKTFHFIQKR